MSPVPERPRASAADDPVVEALALAGVRPFTRHRERLARPGNARLVAISGLAILALLPFPYFSALRLGLLWRVHYFSGVLLLPLLAVKLGGTGWRAVRYYLRDSRYREDGPPHWMPRVTAPVLVASMAVLFGSGVVMLLGADRFGPWSTIHNGAAIIFTGALGLHLLAHLWDTPAAVAADVAPSLVKGAARVTGSRRRVALTVAAFVAGIAIAAAAMPISHWQAEPSGGFSRHDG